MKLSREFHDQKKVLKDHGAALMALTSADGPVSLILEVVFSIGDPLAQ